MQAMDVVPWGAAGGGYQVVATGEMAPDSVVFVVPRDAAVRSDSTRTDFAARFAADIGPGGALDTLPWQRSDVLMAQLVVLVVYVWSHAQG